jgi:serine/threonine protein kinase
MTASGVLMGTPAYLPPEQIGGDSAAMGAHGDIYSLGVILYEMLTGVLPFQGTVNEILRKVLTQPPEPPSRHRPDLDPRLEATCLTALAKDPNDRFASMAAFADALENYTQHDTTRTALGREPKGVRWPPANGWRTWAALAALGLLGLGLILGLPALFWKAPAGTERADDILPKGSHWEGKFRFSLQDPLHEVSVTITERSGNQFSGEYATEKNAYRWAIKGTVDNENIQWRFTRALLEGMPKEVVETAFVKGKIAAGVMRDVTYVDANSTAKMELRRTK